MYPAKYQRHLHSNFKQPSVNRPLGCIIKSEEITELDALLSVEFPMIYDMLGGVEGLFMCMFSHETPCTEYMYYSEIIYDMLSKSTYTMLEEIISDYGDFTENGILINAVETEYVSWNFNHLIAKASVIYQNILLELLRALANVDQSVTVKRMCKTRIKDVYFLEFGPIE